MKNQRQFIRKSLKCVVSVFNKEGTSLGHIVDYSEGGVMVASYQAINVGDTIEGVMVDLPNNIGQKRTGSITLLCAWSQPFTNTLFGSGFQLINADETAKDMFKRYDESQDS